LRPVLTEGKTAGDLIIRGAVVYKGPGEEPVPDAEVVVKGNRIAEIRKTEARHGDEYPEDVIEAAGGIVMPGLVNCHTHAAMSIFRGLADDLPLRAWLFERIFPAEARYLDPETVYWGTLLACLEMIAGGTTSVVDGYFFEDAAAQALHESGLRAVVAQGVIDFPAPGVEDPKENLRIAREFIERWGAVSERIIPGIFCHSPLTCSEKTLREARQICSELGLPLQIHLSETKDEVKEILKRTGKRPVAYLDDLGLIDNELIAAHAVHLEQEEIACLAQRGVRVVHVPESNMKLGSGVAPVSAMIRSGMTVGLGTDGCASNNNLDLFQEMDAAAKLAKVFDLDPESLDAATVLRMATSGGASVMGLYEWTGSLEVGKEADVITVDLKKPHLLPVYDPVSALVYSAGGGDVKDVVVKGRVVMRDRAFTTLDAPEIMEKVQGMSRRIAGG